MGFLDSITDAVGGISKAIGGIANPVQPLLSLGGSLLSGVMNTSSAMDRQVQSQDFTAEQYAKRYQTTIQDMQAAGLNPMLAYQGVGGAFPTGSTASAGGMPDLGASISQSRIASAQVANIEADTATKQAQAELIKSQTEASNTSATKMGKEIERLQQEIDNWIEVGREKSLISRGQAWDVAKKTGYEAESAGYQTQIDRETLAARAAAIKHKAQLLGLQVPAAINEAAFENSAMGRGIRYGERGAGVVGNVFSSARQGSKFMRGE